MPNCIIMGCPHKTGNNQKFPGIVLHSFPSSIERIKKWILQTGQVFQDPDTLAGKIYEGKKTDTFRMCSAHFTKDSYIFTAQKRFLKHNALPAIFPQATEGKPLIDEQKIVGKRKKKSERIEAKNISSFICNRCLMSENIYEGKVLVDAGTQTDNNLLNQPQKSQQAPVLPMTQAVLMLSVPLQSYCTPQMTPIIKPPTHALGGLSAVGYNTQDLLKNINFHNALPATSSQSFPFPLMEPSGLPFSVSSDYNKDYRPVEELHLESGVGMTQGRDTLEKIVRGNKDYRPVEELHPESGVGMTQGRDTLEKIVRGNKDYRPVEDLHPESGVGMTQGRDSLEKIVRGNKDYRPVEDLHLESGVGMTQGRDTLEKIVRGNKDYRPVEELHLESGVGMTQGRDTLEKIVRGQRLMVFEDCLDSLVYTVRCQQASGCTKLVKSFNKEYRGSAVVIRGQCEDGHFFKIWESQPRVKRFFAGNVLMAASLFCSGLQYQEAYDLFNNLGLRHISEKKYHYYQKYYCYPAIHTAWEEERKTVTQGLQDSPVSLAGASQYGTSGHNAGHGIYTLTDVITDKIVDLEIIGSTPCQSLVDIEKLSFEVCMSRTMAEGLDVACFVSDRCKNVVKSLKENYPHVVHQFNVWQYAKTISKKLKAASRARFCANIRPWSRTIHDHFVWSVQTSENNEDLLREKWLSVVYHIINKHSWEEGHLYQQCEHGDLSQKTLRETLWLKPGSPSFQKVQEIVTDPQLIEDLRHLTWNCQSGIPTMFHSNVLKGPHSGLDELEARVKLAALHHNQNVGQGTTDGKVLRKCTWDDRARRKRMATKRKSKLLVHTVHEPMSSHYLWTVMEGVLGICEGTTTSSYISKDPSVPLY